MPQRAEGPLRAAGARFPTGSAFANQLLSQRVKHLRFVQPVALMTSTARCFSARIFFIIPVLALSYFKNLAALLHQACSSPPARLLRLSHLGCSRTPPRTRTLCHAPADSFGGFAVFNHAPRAQEHIFSFFTWRPSTFQTLVQAQRDAEVVGVWSSTPGPKTGSTFSVIPTSCNETSTQSNNRSLVGGVRRMFRPLFARVRCDRRSFVVDVVNNVGMWYEQSPKVGRWPSHLPRERFFERLPRCAVGPKFRFSLEMLASLPEPWSPPLAERRLVASIMRAERSHHPDRTTIRIFFHRTP